MIFSLTTLRSREKREMSRNLKRSCSKSRSIDRRRSSLRPFLMARRLRQVKATRVVVRVAKRLDRVNSRCRVRSIEV